MSRPKKITPSNAREAYEPGKLYTFPSGNTYRYDPNGDAQYPWILYKVENPNGLPYKLSAAKERIRIEKGDRIA